MNKDKFIFKLQIDLKFNGKRFFKGKKIAITVLELENKEHRGIASFIKSSIKVLSKYGAEIYLITGFDLDKI